MRARYHFHLYRLKLSGHINEVSSKTPNSFRLVNVSSILSFVLRHNEINKIVLKKRNDRLSCKFEGKRKKTYNLVLNGPPSITLHAKELLDKGCLERRKIEEEP